MKRNVTVAGQSSSTLSHKINAKDKTDDDDDDDM